VNLTDGETRALLVSAVLVLLAALGRMLVLPSGADIRADQLADAGATDSVLWAAESLYAEAERRRRPLTPGERIDPNSADEVELDRLPGVGPALAQSIATHRRSEGPFRSLEDLERVPGLGSIKVKRLAPFTTLPAGVGQGPATGDGGGGSQDADRYGSQLDLNRASAKELQALPGIGPARAQAIVRWRDENGPFRNFQDLSKVPGIGPATVARLRSRIVVRP
jgi:competence protein ComEA